MNKEANQMNTTKPSVEELMRPRVIVENLWPGCHFEVDDILIKDGDYYWVVGDVGWHTKYHKTDIEPYPYLMRPLEWWEERKGSEMPEYIKNRRGEVFKVVEWALNDSLGYIARGAVLWHHKDNVYPATATEYTNYINSKQR